MDQYLQIIIYILSGILGLCVGSFLNVVIYRLPNNMSRAVPASHCPDCKHPLKWYDNIPVLSYTILGGKCRYCKKHIPFRYTAVELLNMALWLVSVWRFYGDGGVFDLINVGVSMFICSVLIVIFFIDLEHMIIFDRFQIMLAVAGVALTVADGLNENAKISVLEHIGGLCIGGGLFFLVYMGSLAILKREGLGGGDVKLAAAAGLILGWKHTLLALLVASIVGSVVLLILNRSKNEERHKEYPFAPFITGGILLSYLFGSPIITWYAGLLS